MESNEEEHYQQQMIVTTLEAIGDLQSAALKLAKAEKPDFIKIGQVNDAIALFSEAVAEILKGESGQQKIQAGMELIQNCLSTIDE